MCTTCLYEKALLQKVGENFVSLFIAIFKKRVIPSNLWTKQEEEEEALNDTKCQFHQCFYVQIFRTNAVSAAFSRYILALNELLYKNARRKMLMKLTASRI